jgi:uncharacterized DUF497 family protein
VPRKDPIESCLGFDWDEDNSSKNWNQPQVTPQEAEQVFFNDPLIVRSDIAHSKHEKRYFALQPTDVERWLSIAFTIRRNLIRVISARAMNRREREA